MKKSSDALVGIAPTWAPAEIPAGGTATTITPLRPARAGRARPERVSVRAARISDMRLVEPLIQRFASENLMLPKSFDQLARNFREFVVAVDETDTVIGCGALRIYTEGLAEICSLAVAPEFQGFGIGRLVVERLVEDAHTLAVDAVFALTLKPDFFERLGFRTVPKDDFPLKVWADCRSCPKLHACDEVAVAKQLG